MAYLVVDREQGPYRSIQEAVEAAAPNTEIRIASGLYPDNVVIKTPGLRLVPKDKDADIIWVASVEPAITVDIPGDGKVFMNNIKLAHTATGTSRKDNKESSNTDKFLRALKSDDFMKHNSDEYNPHNSYAKTLDCHERMNTLIYVKSGKVEVTVGFIYSRTLSSLSISFIVKKISLCRQLSSLKAPVENLWEWTSKVK